jgi:SRSO17 transposase
VAYQYDKTPLNGDLSEIEGSVRFHKVDETKLEAFWDELVREYHYLGYKGQIGARVKYVITLGKQIVGAISFCSAAYQLGPRDDYIGWGEEARLSKLPHLLSNNRFLILPWIRVRNLASQILSKVLRQLREDWEKQYEVTPYMIETFVDREKYLGTCYVAANWTYLGITKGYGRKGDTFVYHGRKKDIYVYIMDRSFSREFRPDIKRLHNEREELEAMINGVPTWFPTILNKIGIKGDFTVQIKQLFASHLIRYMLYLGRTEHRGHFISMLKGFLSDLDRKSIEPIALAYEGVEYVRNLTNFMGKAKWDDVGMHGEYLIDISLQLSHEGGMYTVDETGYRKKGKNSVGVARQYSGQTGKVDNCQIGVMAGYVSPLGYGLIDHELYMPKQWFEDSHGELRKKCGVPTSLAFRTKGEIASEMIQNAFDSGLFQAKYVGADSIYGSDARFLDSLPDSLIYFADVKSDQRVFLTRPELITKPFSGFGRPPSKLFPEFKPCTVKEIAGMDDLPWNEVVLATGAKGPIITKDKVVRVVEVRDSKPGKDIWLYIRMLSDGKLKYALCNAPADAAHEDIRRLALMRWTIEQCFYECKEHLGMDHCETRSWIGWRRHMLLCIIAHLFIIKLRAEFDFTPQAPGSAPHVDEPVSLDDYLDAAVSMASNMGINHPSMSAMLDRPQQILTIGLVQMLISATFVKIGLLLKELDYQLRTMAQAFDSHTRNAIKRALAAQNIFGFTPDTG